MNWMEFCSSKMYFITELRQIIHTEKKIVVTEEQFRISNMPSEVIFQTLHVTLSFQIISISVVFISAAIF